jgi:type IV secretory pathway VirB10-like protein
MRDTQGHGDVDAPEQRVTTLNRKAIMLGLMVVAVTIMVATFFLSPATQRDRRGPVDQVSADQVGDPTAQQNFLASPPDTARFRAEQLRRRQALQGSAPGPVGSADGVSRPGEPDIPDQPVDLFAAQAIERQNASMQSWTAQPAGGAGYGYGRGGGSSALSPGGFQGRPPAPGRSEPRKSGEEIAFERAMGCGIRGCPPGAPAAGAAPSDAEDGPLEGLEALNRAMLEQSRALATAAQSAPAADRSDGASRASPDRYQAFLEAASSSGTDTYVAATVQKPISPYQIMAGTLIPVTLVTAINSDLPGHVVAQVTRNVYDTHQIHLLIPAGARFLGRVDNQVIRGQSRVNIAWLRLVYPDNRSISLPSMVGMDREGAVGIRDRVNNHTGRTFLNALLLSAISAGAQVSQPQRGSVLAAPGAGEVAAGAAGQQLSQVSAEMIRRDMNSSPTLHVRQGFNFYVYVSQDLVLEPYDR